MTSDAWKLQGMDGAVFVPIGQTFTGLSRGVFLSASGSFALTAVVPNGGTNSGTITTTVETYVPGPFTSIAASGSIAIAYPESASYTVA